MDSKREKIGEWDDCTGKSLMIDNLDFLGYLNKLGYEGWELVTVQGSYYIFKRPKTA